MGDKVVNQPQHHRRRDVGQVAGSAAAECAAVWCCFPCAVLSLVAVAVYKVPKGLVKRAAHKRWRRLAKNNNVGDKDNSNDIVLLQGVDVSDFAVGSDEEKGKGEEEMWARFAGTGFWPSDSQRHQP